MIAYASRTGTKSTIAAMSAAGWRVLISATGVHRSEGLPYAIDNGAFTAFQKGRAFDHVAFRALLTSHGAGADWIVLPDVVADRAATLALSRDYLDEFGDRYPWLLAVQDGMDERDVEAFLPHIIGIAIGGSTRWKENSAAMWGAVARKHGKHLHMLRVNTARRLAIASSAGCHSFDGTSVTAFPCTLDFLDFHRRQTSMEFL